MVNFETTAWLPSSVPAIELDEELINALIGMAGQDQRQVFMCQAETAAERMHQEMYSTKLMREKDLAEVRRKLKKLVDTTIEQGLTASAELVPKSNEQLAELKLFEQQLIGQFQACDYVVLRLELTELNTEAAIDQVNSIEEFWKSEDYDRLKEVIDLIVGSVIVYAPVEKCGGWRCNSAAPGGSLGLGLFSVKGAGDPECAKSAMSTLSSLVSRNSSTSTF